MINANNVTITDFNTHLAVEVLEAIGKAIHQPAEFLTSVICDTPKNLKPESKKASLAGAFVAMFLIDPLGIQPTQWAIMEKEFDKNELYQVCEILSQNLNSPIQP